MKMNQIFDELEFIDSEEISVIVGGCSSSSSSSGHSSPTPMTPSGYGMGSYSPSAPGVSPGVCGGF